MSNPKKEKELIDNKHISSVSIEKFIDKLYLDESILPESDKKLTDAIRIAKYIIDRTLDNLLFNEVVDFNYAVAQAHFRNHFQWLLDVASKSIKVTYEQEIKEMPEKKMKYLRDALHYQKANDIFELARYTDLSLEALNILLKQWGVTSDNFGNLIKPQIIPYKANFLSKDDEKYVLMRCTYYAEEDDNLISLELLSDDLGVNKSVIAEFLESKGFRFSKTGNLIRQKPHRRTDYLLLRLIIDHYAPNKYYEYPELKVFIHHSDYSRIIRTHEIDPEDYDFIKGIIHMCEKRFQSREDIVEGD